jgi:sn-glycerol 3-phosphate transport system ATP-binding protein
MAQLVIRNLTRRFSSGGGVSNVSLSAASGEFVVLLGPSGCGKSTLLRLVAGLDRPDSGEIEIDGVNQLNNGFHRDSVAMVFQNFALYPHMTAFQNIAFPLRLRRTPSDELDRRVRDSASKAGLDLDLNRYPRELSGGERQRVALARALVRQPEIVLMDEALSSLDAQLRLSLRTELKTLQRNTGRTFVYVTHDQAEALALADTLMVMRDGMIEQTGVPEEVFNKPSTEFVARFLGNPPMNLFQAKVVSGGIQIGGVTISMTIPNDVPASFLLGIRPRDFRLDQGDESLRIDVTVDTAEYAGATFIIHAHSNELRLVAEVPTRVEPASQLRLYVSKDSLHFFDDATGRRIGA